MKTKGLAYNVVLIMASCVLSAGGAWAVPSSDTIIGDNFIPIGSDTNTTTTGTADVFIGGAAGQSNISGSDNTFIGHEAGLANRDGSSNTYLGRQAGMSNTSGKENTFIGFASGSANLDGSGNVFLGNLAGSSETGSNKLYIDNCFFTAPFVGCILPLIYGEFDNRILTVNGNLNVVAPSNGVISLADNTNDGTTKAARMVLQHFSNSQIPVYLFGGASAAANNFVAFGGGSTIGNAATQIDFYTASNTTTPVGSPRITIKGNGRVGIGTQTPSHLIQLSGGAFSDGATWTDASSGALKENIRDLSTEEANKTLQELNPVKYNYKTDKEDKHVGFIAEDVPDLVATKDRKGLSPMDIVAVLTKVVKEQQKTIAEQRSINEVLMEKLSKLEAEVNRLKSKDMTAKAMNQD